MRLCLLIVAASSVCGASAQDNHVVAATRSDAALGVAILDAQHAGNRIVAVGEHGDILLSDDNGKTQRQAMRVPIDFTLTSVCFVDPMKGWAVGHAGSIIHTEDGGETWSVQRIDTSVDQPLLTVYFHDAQTGWAAGLWSLLLSTRDGGKTWDRVKLPVPEGQKRSDLNLLRIFHGSGNELYIAAEQGNVLRSNDLGVTWGYMKTGGKGSLWAGASTADDVLIVGGLRGKMFRSTDAGVSWSAVDSGTDDSITQIIAVGKGLWASSLDGKVIQSMDDGETWKIVFSNGPPLTSMAVLSDRSYLLYSKQGMVRAKATSSLTK